MIGKRLDVAWCPICGDRIRRRIVPIMGHLRGKHTAREMVAALLVMATTR